MLRNIFLFIFFAGIVLLSFYTRKRFYAQIPLPGQSTDEYSYAWVGMSLYKLGMPVGISGFPGYENRIVKYVNVDNYMKVISSDPLEINYPWMDHPPLLGLITGIYAVKSGAVFFSEATALLIRRPMILLGSVSVMLLMWFFWKNFGAIYALSVGLIYATAPLIVLSSRMVQAENAIIPCILLVMIFLSYFLDGGGDFWLILAAMISGIATLFKLTGVVCYLIAFLVLMSRNGSTFRNNFLDFLYFLSISLPITGLYFVYGLYYGKDNFLTILRSNYTRFYGIGPGAIVDLIVRQRLTQHKFIPEVWVVCGWFSYFLGMGMKIKNKGFSMLKYSVLAYLVVYLFFGSQPYGWYAFPFWPLLIGVLIAVFYRWVEFGLASVGTVILGLAMLGMNISRIINIDDFQKYAGLWRYSTSGLLIFAVLFSIFQVRISRKSRQLFFIAWLLVMIVINLWYFKGIDVDFWWNNIS